MRLSSESPLIQSLIKERKVSPLCYCVLMTLMLGIIPPPLHPIINKIIKLTSSVIAMFRCLLKVEVWIQILIQCVWTSVIYPNPKYRSFPFWPFPKFTPPTHAPFNKSYQVCYALIGNYPSFKMIPNTTYIVLILKKYNRSKSSFLTVLGIYFVEDGAFIKKKKNVLFMQILCAPMKLRYAGDKYLVVILCKWTILDNKCINIHTALS